METINSIAETFDDKIFAHHSYLKEILIDDLLPPNKSGKWSEKEILGHLIDSALNNYRRFLMYEISGNMTFSGYDQEAWVNIQNYNSMSWVEIVLLWSELNRHLGRLIKNLSCKILTKKTLEHNLYEVGFNNFRVSEAYCLNDFILDYLDHIDHHINQIRARLNASNHHG